jgi:hypothetical protein
MPSVGEDIKQVKPSDTAHGNKSWKNPLWKIDYQYLLKLNICILCDPELPLTEIYTSLFQKTCSETFIMVSLTTAPN